MDKVTKITGSPPKMVYNPVLNRFIPEGKLPEGFMNKFPSATNLYAEKLLERFFSKVDKKEGGCWIWRGKPNRGYGRFTYGSKKTGSYRLVLAHRFAYEMLVCRLEKGIDLFRACGNRMCVNPEHMREGCESSNMKRYMEPPDVVVRGRNGKQVYYVLRLVGEDKNNYFYESGLESEVEASVTVRKARRYKPKLSVKL